MKENCLAVVNPHLISEWHLLKNGILTPYDVTIGSHKKIWWKCKKDHEWKTFIYGRHRGSGCPYCAGQRACKENCLETLNPQLSKEWHPTKNGTLTPSDVMPGSSKKAWWLCCKGHEWKTVIYVRQKCGCPYCGCKKVCNDNCVATLRPDLGKQWHPTKNGDLTPNDIVLASEKRIWWLCDKGHEWQCVMSSRKWGSGCPCCAGKKVCKDNCLATLNPELSKEWHPSKNKITPYDVTFSSAKKAWWKCSKNHEWIARIDNRLNGKGCPHCVVFRKESECRSVFENIFKKQFPRNRKILDCRLELDGYCDELKLAFEYNGEQHYKLIPFWHKTEEYFKTCQERDNRKAHLCSERGIRLIVIPYTAKDRLEEFIGDELKCLFIS